MRIEEHRSYTKAFAKLPKKLKIAARNRIALFIDDRKNPLLADHPLSGRMQGLRAFSVAGDYRIVYRIEENGDIVFVFLDIGPHAEVYY